MNTMVTYATDGVTAASFQEVRRCGLPLAELVARLRAAIEAAGLWVLHEVDPQMLLARGGFAIGPARQILFFHPRFVARLLAADPAALPEAPLKFVLLEQPDGTTTLRWFDPVPNFERYGDPALAALGQELGGLCATIVHDALKDGARGVG